MNDREYLQEQFAGYFQNSNRFLLLGTFNLFQNPQIHCEKLWLKSDFKSYIIFNASKKISSTEEHIPVN